MATVHLDAAVHVDATVQVDPAVQVDPPTPARVRAGRSRRPLAKLPLSLFGIPLGVAGLGGGWSAATGALNAPHWPNEVLYAAATVLWLAFGLVYLVQGVRRRGSFRTDLRHPVEAPNAAFIPLVGILLSAHYSEVIPVVGRALCLVFVITLAVVAAQQFAHWLTGGVTMQAIHPGYFVPVVAGAFVGSIGLSSIGLHDAALAAFGVGIFFWLVIGTVVCLRLMTAGALPDAAKPALAAFVAAPATASIAWIVAHPGPMGIVQLLLTGILAMMLLVQVVLIGEYRRLPFSLSFWIFTFPIASTANYAVRWFAASGLPGWQIGAWIFLGAATLFIAAIAAMTLTRLARPARVATL
ncbi:MAG: TDT family transporter [Cryobacterium sp.]